MLYFNFMALYVEIVVGIIIVNFYQEKPLVAQKLQKVIQIVGSAPYSGWSSPIKPSC